MQKCANLQQKCLFNLREFDNLIQWRKEQTKTKTNREKKYGWACKSIIVEDGCIVINVNKCPKRTYLEKKRIYLRRDPQETRPITTAKTTCCKQHEQKHMTCDKRDSRNRYFTWNQWKEWTSLSLQRHYVDLTKIQTHNVSGRNI